MATSFMQALRQIFIHLKFLIRPRRWDRKKQKDVIEWTRSDEGHIRSKDGEWEIFPLFIGRTTPQGYELYRGVEKITGRTFDTQSEAKLWAKKLKITEAKKNLFID